MNSENKILSQLEARVSAVMRDALFTLGEIAAGRGEGLYLVGGAVRDLLLGRGGGVDIDLVVEGDAQAFAYTASQRLGAKCAFHKTFGTATIELPAEAGGRIDLATARTETYRRPGALPNVSPAKSINDDLFRRDFTINAMAASLAPGERGEIVDPHGGLDDLRDGLLRVLHPRSFIDDPTRILRGLRFRARLDFAFELGTDSLMGQALDEQCFNMVSGGRIKKEITLALEEPRRADIINELSRLDIDGALAPGLALNPGLFENPDGIEAAMRILRGAPEPAEFQPWVAYLLAAAEGSDAETLEALARRLSLTKKEAAPFFDPAVYSPNVRAQLADPETSAEEFDELIAASPGETLLLLHAADGEGALRARIEEYAKTSRGVRLEISGGDLLAMGREPSPMFGEVLREVRRAKIRGEVNNRRQELALARKLLERWG